MNENPDRTQRPAAERAGTPDLVQMEKDLQQQLKQPDQNPKDVLWKLAWLYNATRRPEQAMKYLRQLLAAESDLEIKAACILGLGQSMEQLNDFPAAIQFYREAMIMEPARNDTWYFIHNNLGYSYNQIGQFAEGEKCCRTAIQINPARPNAHKILGIAMSAQGRYREAALSYITGTYNHAGDGRSFKLLKELVQEHPALEFEFLSQIERCETMVELAARALRSRRP
jgi:tetratricopeptide (TPR) repeat protein